MDVDSTDTRLSRTLAARKPQVVRRMLLKHAESAIADMSHDEAQLAYAALLPELATVRNPVSVSSTPTATARPHAVLTPELANNADTCRYAEKDTLTVFAFRQLFRSVVFQQLVTQGWTWTGQFDDGSGVITPTFNLSSASSVPIVYAAQSAGSPHGPKLFAMRGKDGKPALWIDDLTQSTNIVFAFGAGNWPADTRLTVTRYGTMGVDARTVTPLPFSGPGFVNFELNLSQWIDWSNGYYSFNFSGTFAAGDTSTMTGTLAAPPAGTNYYAWAHRPCGAIEDLLQLYTAQRINGKSLRMTNVAPTVALGGRIAASTLKVGEYWDAVVTGGTFAQAATITDTFARVASRVDVAMLQGETGCDGWLGAADINAFSMRPFSDSDTSVREPVLDPVVPDQPGLMMCFEMPSQSFNNLSSQRVYLYDAVSLELETSSTAVETDYSRLSPNVANEVLGRLRSVPKFTENPNHITEFLRAGLGVLSNIAPVLSAIGSLHPSLMPLAQVGNIAGLAKPALIAVRDAIPPKKKPGVKTVAVAAQPKSRGRGKK